jgi:hypothetical protein
MWTEEAITYFKIISQYFPRGPEEFHGNLSQEIRCPDQCSNLAPLEQKSESLPCKPFCSAICCTRNFMKSDSSWTREETVLLDFSPANRSQVLPARIYALPNLRGLLFSYVPLHLSSTSPIHTVCLVSNARKR